MEIILPEQNYSLDEINTTVYTAVKGYIENIRLLKLADTNGLYDERGHKVTVPFPTFNQIGFDWEWNKDVFRSTRKIKTGDDLTLEFNSYLKQPIKGLSYYYMLQAFISVTKVRKSKKNSQLGYKFKSIISVHTNDIYIARIKRRQGLYVSDFLFSSSWNFVDKSKIYSYEDTQVQQSQTTIEANKPSKIFHIPKGQLKWVDVSDDTKLGLPNSGTITLMHIDANKSATAFASFVKQMKRN